MTTRGKYLTTIITVVSVTVTAAWAVFSFGVGQADKAEDGANEVSALQMRAHEKVHAPLEKRIQALETRTYEDHERLIRLETGIEFLVEKAKEDD